VVRGLLLVSTDFAINPAIEVRRCAGNMSVSHPYSCCWQWYRTPCSKAATCRDELEVYPMGTSQGKDFEDAQPSRDRLRNGHGRIFFHFIQRSAAMRNLRIAIRLVRILSQVIRRRHSFHLRARENFRSQGISATGCLALRNAVLICFLRVRIITNSVIKSTLGQV